MQAQEGVRYGPNGWGWLVGVFLLAFAGLLLYLPYRQVVQIEHDNSAQLVARVVLFLVYGWCVFYVARSAVRRFAFYTFSAEGLTRSLLGRRTFVALPDLVDYRLIGAELAVYRLEDSAGRTLLADIRMMSRDNDLQAHIEGAVAPLRARKAREAREGGRRFRAKANSFLVFAALLISASKVDDFLAGEETILETLGTILLWAAAVLIMRTLRQQLTPHWQEGRLCFASAEIDLKKVTSFDLRPTRIFGDPEEKDSPFRDSALWQGESKTMVAREIVDYDVLIESIRQALEERAQGVSPSLPA